MKILKNKWTIIGVLLAAIGLLTAFKYESKNTPQYFTEKVQKGDVVIRAYSRGELKPARVQPPARQQELRPEQTETIKAALLKDPDFLREVAHRLAKAS